MSWQTKGRIEIYGQGGPCDRSRVEVSHAFPPMLAGYVPPQEWEDFCCKLDEALGPAQAVKDLEFKLMIFVIGFVVLLFIWTCVLYSNYSYTSSTWDDNWWIYFCVMAGLALFPSLYIKLKMSKATNEVRNVVKRLCDDESNKYPLMTFQVKIDTVLLGAGGGGRNRPPEFRTFNYVEVNMAPSAMPTQPVPGQFTGLPFPTMTMMAGGAPGGVYGGGMIGGVYGGGGVGGPVMPTMMQPQQPVNGAMSSSAAVPPPAAPPPVAVAVATASSSSSPKSAVERLTELERLKGMLSEEEYQKKKLEILDSL